MQGPVRTQPTMLPMNSSPNESPSVDIRLTQHPNQFFFPGNTVSGQVVYESGDENEVFDLHMVFEGINHTTLKGRGKHSEQATLFQYKLRLHSGPRKLGQGRVGMSKYPFNFRFPSNTDNRSFIQPRDAVVSQTWSSTVHELPPSFELEERKFDCSVEYMLRVELYHGGRMSTSMKLPIVFLPFRASSMALKPNSISIPGITQLTDYAMSVARRDSVIEVRDEVNFKLAAEAPYEIIVGRTFRLDACIEFDATILLDDELPEPSVHIDLLQITSTTACRAFRQSTRNPTALESEHRRLSQHSMTLMTIPVRPSIAARPNELRFSFEATMPSHSSPSFRSFLVAHSYRLQALFVAEVDGKPVELALDEVDISVLSSVAPTLGNRRLTAPMIPNSTRQRSIAFGRPLACPI